MKKIVTFVWYSNGMFRYTFKAEFVTLVTLKAPSGTQSQFLSAPDRPPLNLWCLVTMKEENELLATLGIMQNMKSGSFM